MLGITATEKPLTSSTDEVKLKNEIKQSIESAIASALKNICNLAIDIIKSAPTAKIFLKRFIEAPQSPEKKEQIIKNIFGAKDIYDDLVGAWENNQVIEQTKYQVQQEELKKIDIIYVELDEANKKFKYTHNTDYKEKFIALLNLYNKFNEINCDEIASLITEKLKLQLKYLIEIYNNSEYVSQKKEIGNKTSENTFENLLSADLEAINLKPDLESAKKTLNQIRQEITEFKVNTYTNKINESQLKIYNHYNRDKIILPLLLMNNNENNQYIFSATIIGPLEKATFIKLKIPIDELLKPLNTPAPGEEDTGIADEPLTLPNSQSASTISNDKEDLGIIGHQIISFFKENLLNFVVTQSLAAKKWLEQDHKEFTQNSLQKIDQTIEGIDNKIKELQKFEQEKLAADQQFTDLKINFDNIQNDVQRLQKEITSNNTEITSEKDALYEEINKAVSAINMFLPMLPVAPKFHGDEIKNIKDSLNSDLAILKNFTDGYDELKLKKSNSQSEKSALELNPEISQEKDPEPVENPTQVRVETNPNELENIKSGKKDLDKKIERYDLDNSLFTNKFDEVINDFNSLIKRIENPSLPPFTKGGESLNPSRPSLTKEGGSLNHSPPSLTEGGESLNPSPPLSEITNPLNSLKAELLLDKIELQLAKYRYDLIAHNDSQITFFPNNQTAINANSEGLKLLKTELEHLDNLNPTQKEKQDKLLKSLDKYPTLNRNLNDFYHHLKIIEQLINLKSFRDLLAHADKINDPENLDSLESKKATLIYQLKNQILASKNIQGLKDIIQKYQTQIENSATSSAYTIVSKRHWWDPRTPQSKTYLTEFLEKATDLLEPLTDNTQTSATTIQNN